MRPDTHILYGIHPIAEAIAAGRRKVSKLYVSPRPSERITRIATQAKSRHIPMEITPVDRLRSMAGTKSHQGICARVSDFVFSDIQRLLASAGSGLTLILDGLLDPRNIGALIRTAHCVGVGGVILPKNRTASPTPAVSLVSAGALEHIQLAQVTNISRVLKQLKSTGVWIAGLDPSAKQTIFEADLSGPLVLVVGSEEKGIRPLVKKNCDFLVSIPQQGRVDSLNVSVAGAVALYEAFRQRQAAKVKAARYKK
jgi:23S rRNA (guanosine2251-2'-O)-methyltransferase